MNVALLDRWLRPMLISLVLVLGLGLAALAGCAGLLPKAPAAPALYGLDTSAGPGRAAAADTSAPPPGKGPTLIVNPPRAAAGFDSPRMLYVRRAHRVEAFANSEWVEAPARLLAQPIVAELQRSNMLRSVVAAPSAATADWRLDVELLHLQQDFTVVPSRLRLSVRATLIDTATRRVLASREFSHSVAAPSEDAYGGVLAAQAALQAVLGELRPFCEGIAGTWQAPLSPP
jgi:cholesterol transport system auxiliary component